MIRPEVIRKRLNRLDEYLEILLHLQHYSYEEFISNPERYGSAERFLHLAIEAITDIGNHVIADEALGTVDRYSDIPRILAERGYIDEALENRWIRMIGFRNILVHAYLDIDHRIVHETLHKGLEDLQALKRAFARLL